MPALNPTPSLSPRSYLHKFSPPSIPSEPYNWKFFSHSTERATTAFAPAEALIPTLTAKLF